MQNTLENLMQQTSHLHTWIVEDEHTELLVFKIATRNGKTHHIACEVKMISQYTFQLIATTTKGHIIMSTDHLPTLVTMLQIIYDDKLG